MGDPDPHEIVILTDSTEQTDESSPAWARTFDGDWKGYKDGGKVYLSWEELTRRYGPLTTDGLEWPKVKP